MRWLKKSATRSLIGWNAFKRWFVHYIGGLYKRIDDHHIFLLAGGLAFSLFVCIIPLVLIIFSVVGLILEEPSVVNEINVFIDRVIPYEDYASFVKTAVFSRIDEFRVFKSLAGIIGLFGLFFASSGLFSSMRTVLNMVFRAKSKQSALISKLRDFGLIIIVLVYFLLSTTILPVLSVAAGFAGRWHFLESLRFGLGENILIGLFSFLIILIAFAFIYWAVPQVRLSRKVVFISALSAAILWALAKQFFGLYITNVFTLKKIYGAYALIVVVAFWVYYTAIVFIVGAEIGQLFRERLRTPQENIIA
jgi:membrane protein